MARRLPTPVSVEADALYVAAPKIHPREIGGRFQSLRKAAVFWLLGMYYLFPWLPWEGRQAVLFDLPARKFYVLGLVFWPQDFFLLAMLLVIAAVTLFFVTAIAGRLWCGYACPQTVWTEVFIWIEQWAEGSRNQRVKLDAAPWSWNKLRRRGGKQLVWIALSLWTGFTFVGFFTPIRTLAQEVASLQLGPWELFWGLFYSLATYGNAGFLREQVCKYMCPYARFQGAMFDRNTLVIAYDEVRGEPRGPRKRGAPRAGTRDSALGDCIDCLACVQVCPTGIDIREGLQYECIACGACIDACDEIMDKMSYPRGLVRYTTENRMEGRPGRLLRPRVLIYAALLGVLIGAFAWTVTHRVPLRVDVLRDRNALYRIGADGTVENAYTLKLINRDRASRRFLIAAEGAQHIRLAGAPMRVEVAAGQVASIALTLQASSGTHPGKSEIAFRVSREDDAAINYVQRSSFFAPASPTR